MVINVALYKELRLTVNESSNGYPIFCYWDDMRIESHRRDMDSLFFLGNTLWQEFTFMNGIIAQRELCWHG